jgi:plastocyanin
MTITRSIALAAALALTALVAPATTTVSIIGSAGSSAFNPNPVSIASGDSVAWTNNDFTTHRIVLDDGSFDSGNLSPGSSSAATPAITTTGAFHCVIHPSMTGTITVSAPCTYTLSAASAPATAGGTAGTVGVTAGAGCAWTAVSNSSFITVTVGASGTGNGSVSYAVAANPSTSPRTGTITIAGQTFTITQAGVACVALSAVPAPPNLPDATLGVPVSITIIAGGGTPPYSFALQSGTTLPAGITLSSAGVLSGTPTAPGLSGFTILVTDSAGCLGNLPYQWRVLAPAPALPGIWLGLLASALIALAVWRQRVTASRERSG